MATSFAKLKPRKYENNSTLIVPPLSIDESKSRETQLTSISQNIERTKITHYTITFIINNINSCTCMSNLGLFLAPNT